MDLNSFVFPAPTSSYDGLTFPGELIWVPGPSNRSIPCLFLQHLLGSSKLAIYYHGNAEDLGLAYELCAHLRRHLKTHVLIVEYPGYGMYPGRPSAEAICEDADAIMLFLCETMHWSTDNFLVLGRSIGTGPACYLASKYSIGALVLISAYTSLRSVVKHLVGSVAQYFVSQRFNSLQLMESIHCPTFFLHGLKDTLIPATESQRLHARCKGVSFIHLQAEMDHNEFEYVEDLIFPLSEFLRKCEVVLEPVLGERSFCIFPEEFHDLPEGIECFPGKSHKKKVAGKRKARLS